MTKRLIDPYQQVWDSADTILDPYELKTRADLQDEQDFEPLDFVVPELDALLIGVEAETKELIARFHLDDDEPEPMDMLDLLMLITN